MCDVRRTAWRLALREGDTRKVEGKSVLMYETKAFWARPFFIDLLDLGAFSFSSLS